MATLTQRSLEEVVFQTIRGNLPPMLDDLPFEQRDLVTNLEPLCDAALWAIAKEKLPLSRWRRHQHLLHKVADGTLTPAEQTALTELRVETDRFVIRRSYALALLKWRGYTIPTTL
jgi:hypothetical protein